MSLNGSRDDDSRPSIPIVQTCCLMENGKRCDNTAGNASFSFRVQKLASQRKLGFSLDSNAKHTYICHQHKNTIQKSRNKRRKNVSDDESDSFEVDFSQLQVSTLRRYKKHFKIPTRPGMNKAQLVESIAKHFKKMSVAEKETITFFIYMVKTHKSKFDQRNGSDVV